MRRLAEGLVAVALVLIGVSGSSAAGAGTRPPPTRVSLFGDSLASQAQLEFVAEMTRRAPTPSDLRATTYPMTALCDFRTAFLEDLVRRRPQVLVLEFSGNSFSPCMGNGTGASLEIGSAPWRDRYLEDLRVILTVAGVTGTEVVWATAPPVHAPPLPESYPRTLAASVRRLSLTHPRLHVVSSGKALTTDGRSFTRTLPCRPDEHDLCRDGNIEVRADDGLHFDCFGDRNPLGGCIGYSAGARRFGEALADAALATMT